MPMYLTQGLHRAVQSHPQRTATIFGSRQRNYAEHGERVARLAAALQALGVARGDRVGMLGLNSDRYLEFFYGSWWAGAAVNPVNIRWSAAEIVYSLDDCDTRILFVDEKFQGLVAELRTRSKVLQTVVYTGDGPVPEGMLDYEALLAAAEPAADVCSSGNDLAAVMYTGGTTGFPKGVMLSHENLCVSAQAYVGGGMTHGDERVLLIAPMFHIAAASVMIAHATVGGSFVIAPMFTPLGTLQAVQQHRIAMLLLVPTMVQLTVDHPESGQYDLSSVTTLGYGGSVISVPVLERAMIRFPNAGFVQVYGMTELSPCATLLGAAEHRGGKPGLLSSAGRASLSSEVRVVGADGKEAPRGTVGEVAVRGGHVMLGYWNKPEQTAAVLRDGWMHTGDGGRMDEDGYLYIVDRMKDMIVSGGENVYSAEVENALAQHPAVAVSAVIGIPSAAWGEAVHAVVVLKPGTAAAAGAERDAVVQALTDHCRTLIAPYKCPRSMEFRDALPTTGAGKVLKTELRRPHWEGRERAVN